ncbi:hypothetical protein pipiens_001175 [Culex pipiens pipiens]|uniref:RRM domain-containing protein n=1 Tax=Culex pipiens pipiens TaxID=38569 RepID=A0ABD1DJ98_CULPP
MVKAKRKQPPVVAPPQDDDSGSDYDVDRVILPAKVPKTVQEEFPLPKQVLRETRRKGAPEPDTESSSEEEEDDEGGNLPTLTKSQIAAILQTIKNNKRLVLNISNVNFTTAKEEIFEHFEKAGRVKSVRIPKRRSAGFAFVEMVDPEGFQRAGKKKSHQKILLLEQKNAEIRKMRKKNRSEKEATAVSLTPKALEPKVKERDPILDRKKAKPKTKKDIKAHNKKVSMRAKDRQNS